MKTEIVYEYWDAELKNQSKQRLTALERAIANYAPADLFATRVIRLVDRWYAQLLSGSGSLLLKETCTRLHISSLNFYQ